MRLLGLDPGATTGWALFVKGAPTERYRSGQVSQEKVWNLLTTSRMAQIVGGKPHDHNYDPDLTIICESFQHRQLPKVDLSPVEVIGVVKEWARQNQIDIIWQTPAQGKAFFDNDRLDALGVLKKPATIWRHANDAMRHIHWYLGFGKGVTLGEDVIPKRR